MRHFVFAVVLGLAPERSHALQVVPGRDLLQFPLGSLDRARSLGGDLGDGLGNPASIGLAAGERFRVAAAALQTPADQGVTAQLLALSAALPRRLSAGVSIARFSISDLIRTEDSPREIDPDISYGTTLYSATVSRRNSKYVSAGIAVRYRTGELDGFKRGATLLDGGILADSLGRYDGRVGIATFLWRPAQTRAERTTVNMAGDLRVAGHERAREVRVGYSLAVTEREERDEFAYLSARDGVFAGRFGIARIIVSGRQQPWRVRLGIGVHYEEYVVGLAREENGAGLGGVYQFSLTTTRR